jgi:hypothetical protein
MIPRARVGGVRDGESGRLNDGADHHLYGILVGLEHMRCDCESGHTGGRHGGGFDIHPGGGHRVNECPARAGRELHSGFRRGAGQHQAGLRHCAGSGNAHTLRESGSLLLPKTTAVDEEALFEPLLHAASDASSAHSTMLEKRCFVIECPPRCALVAYAFLYWLSDFVAKCRRAAYHDIQPSPSAIKSNAGAKDDAFCRPLC